MTKQRLDICLASFFSIHRPVSITGPFPPEATLEDVEKIFTVRPKTQRPRMHDVIYTLSSAVQQMEGHASNQAQPQNEESAANRADLIKALTQHNNANQTDSNHTQHLDGQPQSGQRITGLVKIDIQAIARQYRPFNPPPAPVPFPEFDSSELQNTTSSQPTLESNLPPLEFELQSETVQSMSTSTAQKKLVDSFFTPSYASQGRSRRGLTLARHLQQMLEIRRIGQVKRMDLISVKRQRKLKMKKHKYKKLQRKTRNLRRRQGKI